MHQLHIILLTAVGLSPLPGRYVDAHISCLLMLLGVLPMLKALLPRSTKGTFKRRLKAKPSCRLGKGMFQSLLVYARCTSVLWLMASDKCVALGWSLPLYTSLKGTVGKTIKWGRKFFVLTNSKLVPALWTFLRLVSVSVSWREIHCLNPMCFLILVLLPQLLQSIWGCARCLFGSTSLCAFCYKSLTIWFSLCLQSACTKEWALQSIPGSSTHLCASFGNT